jgi:hypothetical protein
MRTLLSHELTARWLAAGDQDKAEMLSSGGDASWTSVAKSPRRLVPCGAGFPKSVDILVMPRVGAGRERGRKWKVYGG